MLGVIFHPSGRINDLDIYAIFRPKQMKKNISGCYFMSAVAILMPHLTDGAKNLLTKITTNFLFN